MLYITAKSSISRIYLLYIRKIYNGIYYNFIFLIYTDYILHILTDICSDIYDIYFDIYIKYNNIYIFDLTEQRIICGCT